MKNSLGTWLIVFGTVFGSLGGAASEKVNRELALVDAPDGGEFLLRDVERDGNVLATGGTELTGAVVAALEAAGVDSVEVRTPPRDRETLAVSGPDAEGRVLAADGALGDVEVELDEGRRVPLALLERLAAAGVATVSIETEGGVEDWATDRVVLDDDGNPSAPAGARLAEALRFREAAFARAGSFVDAALLDELRAAGTETVEAVVRKPFSFGAWEGRALFFAGLVLMVAGIAAKRSHRSEEAAAVAALAASGDTTVGPGAQRARLERLIAAAEDIAARADTLAASDLQAAVEPLIVGEMNDFVEDRQSLVDVYGTAGMAEILSPFAQAERRLNRTWSAGVDGYVDEARTCIGQVAPLLRDALAAFPA